MAGSRTGNGNGRRQVRGRPPRRFDDRASLAFGAEVLGRLRIRGAVIGRLAVWAWVSDMSEHEMTKDVDFAVTVGDSSIIAQALHEMGRQTAQLEIGGVNVEVGERGVNVDFIHRLSEIWGDLSGLYLEAIAAAEEEGVFLVDEDGTPLVPIPVVPPEHLVAMKIATGEDKDRRDAYRLIAFGTDEVDVEAVRELLRRHGGASDLARFEQVLRDAGHPGAHIRGRYGKGS